MKVGDRQTKLVQSKSSTTGITQEGITWYQLQYNVSFTIPGNWSVNSVTATSTIYTIEVIDTPTVTYNSTDDTTTVVLSKTGIITTGKNITVPINFTLELESTTIKLTNKIRTIYYESDVQEYEITRVDYKSSPSATPVLVWGVYGQLEFPSISLFIDINKNVYLRVYNPNEVTINFGNNTIDIYDASSTSLVKALRLSGKTVLAYTETSLYLGQLTESEMWDSCYARYDGEVNAPNWESAIYSASITPTLGGDTHTVMIGYTEDNIFSGYASVYFTGGNPYYINSIVSSDYFPMSNRDWYCNASLSYATSTTGTLVSEQSGPLSFTLENEDTYRINDEILRTPTGGVVQVLYEDNVPFDKDFNRHVCLFTKGKSSGVTDTNLASLNLGTAVTTSSATFIANKSLNATLTFNMLGTYIVRWWDGDDTSRYCTSYVKFDITTLGQTKTFSGRIISTGACLEVIEVNDELFRNKLFTFGDFVYPEEEEESSTTTTQ